MSRAWVRQGLVEQGVYGEQGSNHLHWPIIRPPPTKITNRLQVFFMCGLVLVPVYEGKVLSWWQVVGARDTSEWRSKCVGGGRKDLRCLLLSLLSRTFLLWGCHLKRTSEADLINRMKS